MENIQEGLVCSTSEIKKRKQADLAEVRTGLDAITFSYRQTLLLFDEVKDGNYRAWVKPIWVFVMMLEFSNGSVGKLVEYIDVKDEDWACELAYMKALDAYDVYRKQKLNA